MDQDKALRLLLRQLKDIQVQAEKISTGDDSSETIASFARYSTELKEYISKNIESPEIKAYLTELPEINYSRTETKLWQYLLLPAWWFSLYKDYHVKNKTIEEINQVRGKYATLALLVRGLTE